MEDITEFNPNPENKKSRIARWNRRPEYFFWAAFILCFTLFIEDKPPETPILQTAAVASTAKKAPNPYEKLELLAKAVFVYDQRTGQTLYEKNADTELPLASLTKIVTAATALSLVPETTLITIDSEALREEGDSGLKNGEVWVLRDLLKFVLIESSNDGAHAVASSVGMISAGTDDKTSGRNFFIARMNDFAKTLGLEHTRFQNETGLDIGTDKTGGVSTAREAAALFKATLVKSPDIFKSTHWGELVLTNDDGREHKAANTNKSTGKFPLLLASKTGYTDLAGGNLLIAFDAGFNHPIIICVLGSTMDGRFSDAEKLVWATLAYLQTN